PQDRSAAPRCWKTIRIGRRACFMGSSTGRGSQGDLGAEGLSTRHRQPYNRGGREFARLTRAGLEFHVCPPDRRPQSLWEGRPLRVLALLVCMAALTPAARARSLSIIPARAASPLHAQVFDY